MDEDNFDEENIKREYFEGDTNQVLKSELFV